MNEIVCLPVEVIIVAIQNEDVVFVIGNQRGHMSKITNNGISLAGLFTTDCTTEWPHVIAE